MNAIQAEDYVHTMLMVGLEAKAIKKKGRSIKSLKKEKKKKLRHCRYSTMFLKCFRKCSEI